ncbi:MAG: hypothetical protein V2I56_19350 [Desulfobacteraceae bacterium]|jgi:hypothetical protein|nr:hypothetical protein [Desulfobacteraceae bacterium]
MLALMKFMDFKRIRPGGQARAADFSHPKKQGAAAQALGSQRSNQSGFVKAFFTGGKSAFKAVLAGSANLC